MNRRVRLLVLCLLLALGLAACGEDDEVPVATATTAAPTIAPVLAATDTAVPLPTSTPLPAATSLPAATETPTATPLAGGQTDAGGQGQQDPAAATAAASAGTMATWQSLMNVAVLNQGLCTALQGMAQTGQQGGLGALAIGAGLIGAGSVLQSAQQQLGGLMGLSGLGQLPGSLQTDQASMSDVVTRWAGGQLDAAGAGAALQTVCSATNATLSQTQQGAQGAGFSSEQISGMLQQSQQNAGGALGGLQP